MTKQASPEVEEIDVEEWSKKHPDRRPPACRRYRIRIDSERHVVHVPEMTGREILTLAGKPPEQTALYQQFRGGRRKRIALDETVDFRRPGIERFKTLPIDAKDGEDQ